MIPKYVTTTAEVDKELTYPCNTKSAPFYCLIKELECMLFRFI